MPHRRLASGEPNPFIPAPIPVVEYRLVVVVVGKEQITMFAGYKLWAVHASFRKALHAVGLLWTDHQKLSRLGGNVGVVESGPRVAIHPEYPVPVGIVEEPRKVKIFEGPQRAEIIRYRPSDRIPGSSKLIQL